MTSSGEMSPAMMAMPGTWSALAGDLTGVLRMALLTSLTPRWRALAFLAVKGGILISGHVQKSCESFPRWDPVEKLTLLDRLEDLLVALGVSQRHGKVDNVGRDLGVLDSLKVGAWVVIVVVVCDGLGGVGLQLPVEAVGDLLLELLLVCLLILLVLLLVDAVGAELLLLLFLLVLLGLVVFGRHCD